jgi:hypothetical protein
MQTSSTRRRCVCAQCTAALPLAPKAEYERRDRPGRTMAILHHSGDDLRRRCNCKHGLSLRMQHGKVSRSYCAHSKQEDEPHGQPVSLPPAATYDATTKCTTAHRQRRQQLPKHTPHSRYTTNGSRQLVCSACSGESKAFCVTPSFFQQPPSAAHDLPLLQKAKRTHTAQHYTRWERLQSRALLSGIGGRWLAALAGGRKCLLRWRRTRRNKSREHEKS